METMASLPSNIIYTHVCYFFLRYLVHLSSMYSGRSCQVDVKTQTKQAEQPMRVNLGKPWPPNLISRHWFHQILRDFGNQICINMSYRMDQNLSKFTIQYYTSHLDSHWLGEMNIQTVQTLHVARYPTWELPLPICRVGGCDCVQTVQTPSTN